VFFLGGCVGSGCGANGVLVSLGLTAFLREKLVERLKLEEEEAAVG